MRIAYVCGDPGIPAFGAKGASVHVQEVLRVLLAAGHEVDLHCRRTGGEPRGALARAHDDGRLRVHLAPVAGESDVRQRERMLMAAEEGTRRALLAAHADRPFDLVYERYALFAIAGTSFAREAAIPSILEVNAPLPIEQARHRSLVHADTADAVARAVISDASLVTCVSEPVAAWARTQAPAARIVVEPNGVDADRFATASRPAGRPFTVGFVGTLKPWHGTEHLVDAFALLTRRRPDARLVIVGDGPERAALKRRAVERGVADRTVFTGAVDPADVPEQLAVLDAAVAPYPAHGDPYFSPLKVLEYLASGAVVVASRVGQLPELVADGRTGLLVPPSDPEALAAALDRLAADPGLRRSLADAARDDVAQTRTWRHVVRRTLGAAGLPLEPDEEAAA
ncbi:glycosyltransferase family 4 protein [Microbacterium barkeri]|uniref:glycosyltransferase family 4 protein n=1 Tax=Microbacterium barkeri TaxID=33917 RepID=UPI0024AFCF5C|nr:glycosyltransferase family 4 protein [Microbacterium barkeri]MDI6943340.1 glycosyltransferase family 4 protein [Microbacterium barkeri]